MIPKLIRHAFVASPLLLSLVGCASMQQGLARQQQPPMPTQASNGSPSGAPSLAAAGTAPGPIQQASTQVPAPAAAGSTFVETPQDLRASNDKILAVAHKFQEQGQFDKAENLYRMVLKRDPQRPDIYASLAAMELQKKTGAVPALQQENYTVAGNGVLMRKPAGQPTPPAQPPRKLASAIGNVAPVNTTAGAARPATALTAVPLYAQSNTPTTEPAQRNKADAKSSAPPFAPAADETVELTRLENTAPRPAKGKLIEPGSAQAAAATPPRRLPTDTTPAQVASTNAAAPGTVVSERQSIPGPLPTIVPSQRPAKPGETTTTAFKQPAPQPVAKPSPAPATAHQPRPLSIPESARPLVKLTAEPATNNVVAAAKAAAPPVADEKTQDMLRTVTQVLQAAEQILAKEKASGETPGETLVDLRDDELVANLNHPEANRRALAAFRLGRIEHADAEGVTAAIWKALEAEPHALVRIRQAEAIVRLVPTDDKAVSILTEGLFDEQRVEIRWMCACVLDSAVTNPNREYIVADLTAALKDKNAFVRRMAALTLGSFGRDAKKSIPDLVNMLEEDDPTVRDAAAATLDCIVPKLVDDRT